MKKGYVSPTRLSLCEAAVHALALALKQAGRQVTSRQIAAAWDEANAGTGISIPNRHSWAVTFEPAVQDGRVVVSRPGFLPVYTLRSGPEYPLPQPQAVSFTPYRQEISAAAERALALALERVGRQVVWSELQASWCDANCTTERPFLRDTRAGYVTAPSRAEGRIIQNRYQGFTFYTLAERPEYAIPCLRPQFTEERLQVANAAEQALRCALTRTGCQATWSEIRAAWLDANGTECQYNTVSSCRWIFEPLEKAGRIRKTRRDRSPLARANKAVHGALVYYTLVDGPEYPLPAEPEFSGFRLARCEAAERALALALSHAGTQVIRAAICTAWKEANTSHSPEVREPPANGKQLIWTLAPGVNAGRVLVTRRAGQAYYALTYGPTYPLPPRVSGPRVFGHRLRTRMESAERALALAAGKLGRMVETSDIVGAWKQANEEQPLCSISRVLEILGASVQLGHVRHVRQNRHNYFAPGDQPELLPPSFASDLHRVEEAIRRAAARMRSAVLLEEIMQEVDLDPDLHLRGDLTVASILSTLCQWNRIRSINHLSRHAGYFYYAPLDGPTWVRADAEHHLDRRYRAVLGLWRASRGKPFTTRALRRFAVSRPGLWITDDSPCGWSRALKQFRENGDLASTQDGNGHFLRWAPAAEWNGLSPEEREQRLRDSFGREVDPDAPLLAGGTGLDDDATPYDVAHASRARDLRTLVLVAKAVRGASETDPERRRILRARPVTLAHVREVLHTRPALRVGDVKSLASHLSDAVRIRKFTKQTPLVSLGTVTRDRFIDVRATPTGRTYVDYRIAVQAVRIMNARYRVRLLRHASNLSVLRLVPLPQAVLDMRAHLLAVELRRRARALACACRRAELLEEEIRQGLDQIRELRRLATDAVKLVSTLPTAYHERLVERTGISTGAAVEEIRALLPMDLRSTSEILVHLGPAARLPVDAETNRLQRVQKRRSLKWMVDRVGFACHSAVRWGGPSLASLGQQAWHAMGDLRAPELFIGALQDPGSIAAHAPCAAVLGFYDDGPSRAALVDYIRRCLGERGQTGRRTTVVAADTAVLGLAPLPFGACATTLLPDERTVLQQMSMDGIDERIRINAARVLRAWDESWTRDQLLFL